MATSVPNPSPPQQVHEAVHHYTPRAQDYDEAHNGWHIKLGADFVDWVEPRPGAKVLDLACGTGLVAIPMARAIGKHGTVVGVDITPAMLAVGQSKYASLRDASTDMAPIEWIEADVTSSDLPGRSHTIRQILDGGGFDVISVCSAMILLPDPAGAIQLWSSWLREGGKMIVDVGTEQPSVQRLYVEELRREVGAECSFSRDWVKGKHTMEEMYRRAGLEVVSSFRTESQLPEVVYTIDQDMEVFDRCAAGTFRIYQEQGKMEEAREAWKKLWRKYAGQDGTFVDGLWLYITVGVKV